MLILILTIHLDDETIATNSDTLTNGDSDITPDENENAKKRKFTIISCTHIDEKASVRVCSGRGERGEGRGERGGERGEGRGERGEASGERESRHYFFFEVMLNPCRVIAMLAMRRPKQTSSPDQVFFSILYFFTFDSNTCFKTRVGPTLQHNHRMSSKRCRTHAQIGGGSAPPPMSSKRCRTLPNLKHHNKRRLLHA